MKLLRRMLLIVVALVAWEAIARSGTVSPLVCPSLVAIAHESAMLVVRADRLVEVWHSLYRAFAGFFLAAAVGVPLGAIIGRVRWLERIFDPFFAATYPVPKIALYPAFVFLVGIGSLSKIALVFLECFYPIVVNTAAGVRAVDRALVWSALSMGAGRWQVLRKIIVPAAAPTIFAGFRVAMPIALIVVIITEMVGSADGLGYFVMAALSELRTDRMLAGALAIAVIGVALDALLTESRRRVIYWQPHGAVLDHAR
jgi:ABC-type nitrate/sulfonate/bicarbonate transport system permease component